LKRGDLGGATNAPATRVADASSTARTAARLRWSISSYREDRMSSAIYEQIRSNEKYPLMVARRRRLAGGLAAIVLGVFFLFILVVGFYPALLARPVSEGAVTTVAVPIGVAMIVVFWLLTGYYVKRAAREFEQIKKDILSEVKS
jgi:uncharacterized membrane protein (DUF485 family)